MAGSYDRKDHYYREAKAAGYRSRAAFKLIELDKKLKFLKSGYRILDLGCAPGGWLQVAAERVGDRGLVVGVDLEEVEPIPAKEKIKKSPIILCGDLLEVETQDRVRELAGGGIDIVLSDMSPKLSGIRFRDVARSAELVALALDVADSLLKPGGYLVTKAFPGQDTEELVPRFRSRFTRFQRIDLESTRKSSTEQYFIGVGFKGSEGS